MAITPEGITSVIRFAVCPLCRVEMLPPVPLLQSLSGDTDGKWRCPICVFEIDNGYLERYAGTVRQWSQSQIQPIVLMRAVLALPDDVQKRISAIQNEMAEVRSEVARQLITKREGQVKREGLARLLEEELGSLLDRGLIKMGPQSPSPQWSRAEGERIDLSDPKYARIMAEAKRTVEAQRMSRITSESTTRRITFLEEEE